MCASSSARTAPKLLSACSRRRTGSAADTDTRFFKWSGRRVAAAPRTSSEVELGHVRLVEGERRAEDHLRPPVRPLHDRVAAELAGLELLADLARDLLRGDRRHRVPGEVAEILRVPEGELRHGAVEHVLLHLARQPETR